VLRIDLPAERMEGSGKNPAGKRAIEGGAGTSEDQGRNKKARPPATLQGALRTGATFG